MIWELFLFLLLGAFGSVMVVERVRHVRGAKPSSNWSLWELALFFLLIPLGIFNFVLLVILVAVTNNRG